MKIRIFFLFVLSIFINNEAFSCSLAIHEWHLVWYKKLVTETPFLPLCESDILVKGEFQPVKNIYWVTPKANSDFTLIKALLIPVYNAFLGSLHLHEYMGVGLPVTLSPNREKNFPWCKALSWLPLENGSKLGEILNNHPVKDYIVMGSDKNTLKIAIFADALSNNKCFQVVILQDGRLRAVQPSDTKPTATEVRALAYASFIFYGNPINCNFLSISLSPIAGSRCFFFQNEEYADKLVSEGKLARRAASESDPASFNIPDIPED